MKKTSYLNKGRTVDIISLINFLATKPNNCSHQIEIKNSLDKNPNSHKNWETLSKLHPEFFKIRKINNDISCEIGLHFSQNRELTIDERLRLIEIATSLHNSELNERKYWTPIITAIITATIAVIIAIYPLYYNKNKLENNLKNIIHSENIRLVEYLTQLPTNNSAPLKSYNFDYTNTEKNIKNDK